MQAKEKDFLYWNNQGVAIYTHAKAKLNKDLCLESILCFKNAISLHNALRPHEQYYIAEANLNDTILIYETWHSKLV